MDERSDNFFNFSNSNVFVSLTSNRSITAPAVIELLLVPDGCKYPSEQPC